MNAVGKEQEGKLNREVRYLHELIYLSGKEYRENEKAGRVGQGFCFPLTAFVPSWNFKLISCITLIKIKIKFK